MLINKPKFETHDLTAENVAKIAELFPGVVIEGKVNVDLLRSYVGEEIFGDEAYEFTWVGKRAAIAEAGKPIRKTLRPCVEESKDWETTENLYIEGDNLDVLKILQESYLGKVKMIYIDPPYNTGNDFVYCDNYTLEKDEYDEEAGVYDEDGERLFRNTESNGRFHSDWCSMIYPRLVLARNMLRDDGVIFISIDDSEVASLRKICDEIFGASNFLGQFVINSTPNARDYGHIGKMHEYALFYTKNAFRTTTNMLPETDKKFKYTDSKGGYNIHPLYNSNEAFTNLNRPNLFYPFYLYEDEVADNGFYRIGLEKRDAHCVKILPPKSVKNGVQFVWRWGKEKAKKNLNVEIVGYRTSEGEYRIVQKMRHSEKIIRSILSDTKYSSRRGTAEVEEILEGKIFSFPKPFALLSDFVQIAVNEDDIILDFFSGSATTAHAVMQLNAEDGGKRKFIMVQLPEVCAEGTEAAKAGYKNICEIGKERIRRAGEKIKEDAGLMAQDLDIGFRVLKLDDTNMNDVYYAATETTQDMLSLFESNIKPDRTDMDLLFGCLLDWGLPLSMPHTHEIIDGATVHTYNDGDLVACFADKISDTVVKEIAKRQPLRAVFRDSSFTSSPEKINVAEIFKLFAPNTTVRVI